MYPAITLPDKASELILVALEDLEKAEQAPGVAVDMATWHTPHDGVCYVCLAGCVLRRFGPDSEKLTPSMFGASIINKLIALDFLRIGGTMAFVEKLGGKPARVQQFLDAPRVCSAYSTDPAQFKAELRSIAEFFRQRGE